ncbi:hypothetical protein [Bradyrhizobium sp. Tv2a-2]|nr:hypothetical protein [Bradyrhizobium sp. Tv2a-2]
MKFLALVAVIAALVAGTALFARNQSRLAASPSLSRPAIEHVSKAR